MVQNPILMPLIPYHVLAVEPTQPVPGIHSHRERTFELKHTQRRCAFSLEVSRTRHTDLEPNLSFKQSIPYKYVSMIRLNVNVSMSKSAKLYALIPTFFYLSFERLSL